MTGGWFGTGAQLFVPSSQTRTSGAFGSQTGIVAGWQTRAAQRSTPLQKAPSSQAVPSVAPRSFGQVGAAPVQLSTKSQAPVAGRHATPAPAKPSAGHRAELPLQDSATSQTPFAARHSVAGPAKPSAGQRLVVPVQDSATSHTPFAARH